MSADPALVLVHGAWHGSWCWEAVVPELAGVDVRTVELPSVAAPPAGLYADAEVLRAAVAAVAGPVVVCAHSYGGVVASQALAGLSNVTHIVYLCAFALGRGESVLGAGRPPWSRVRDDGFIEVRTPENVFFNDLPEEAARAAAAHLRLQHSSAFTEQQTEAAWENLPTTYVVGTRDQAIPPEAQRRMAAHLGGKTLEIDTSHSPFLSQPHLVATILRETLTTDAQR
ncbi:alpha/beta hydrolase [Amycolatopsis rhabdoformis]|uniref:Alpha/beta hydrolase n=1 Tax=Amycolatopsis rhabdoformis TaxID=1448059 RepID=A0ABZ1IEJ2_9PSEU|nr:alpha/beta hydrolase [Amycolatopsis rhabdoformis]WSE32108.1 alpha/beta hydrolase [Amycolatopsis rhabdoformis]